MLSPTANHPSLNFELPEPLPLAKAGSFCIDLSDLLAVKALTTSHSLSTNDSASIKADEDTTKSTTSAEIDFAPVNSVSNNTKLHEQDQKITIREIISKRAYTKRSNDTKNKVSNNNNNNKKKRLAKLEEDVEENIVKKEKLDSVTVIKAGSASHDPKPLFPEIVFKDGKAQLIAADFSEAIEKVNQELKIVHPEAKKLTMSTSFKQMTHTEKWTEKETEKFYRALEIFGTDFSMIAKVFKTRNRNQIKNKFLREERIAPEKIDGTLTGSKPTNFQVLFRKFEKLKKAQKSIQPNTTAEGISDDSKSFNLLLPVQKSINTQETKPEEILIQYQGRDRRSESFHSTTSIDSMDKAIIEDLADILVPQKKIFGI